MKKMSEKAERLKNQILFVRDTGLTNMFDARAVQKIASDNCLYELVIFIEDHKREYGKFILTGDESLLEVS